MRQWRSPHLPLDPIQAQEQRLLLLRGPAQVEASGELYFHVRDTPLPSIGERAWRGLHLATDADTGRIVASVLTGC